MTSADHLDLQRGGSLPPKDFILLAGSWCQDQSKILLGFVWRGYDQMRSDNPSIDGRDLERSITHSFLRLVLVAQCRVLNHSISSMNRTNASQ